jgi:membrane protein implicated in regulation of membrane protease activity
MKHSTGFDARHLRPRGPTKWRWRFGLLLAALLMLLGIGLSIAGAAALFGQPLGLGTPSSDAALAMAQLGGGLVSLMVGIMLWRRWRRLLRPSSDLNIDPYLLKKRN